MSPSDPATPDSSGDPAGRRDATRRRRAVGALAALLAVAVAVPVGVQLSSPERRQPESETKKQVGQGPVAARNALRLAKQTGKPVEVVADRTESRTVWAQPDGRLKANVHSQPVRAKVDGQWRAIDTDLRPVKGGFAPKAVNGGLVFSAGSRASDRPARVANRRALTSGPAAPLWTELVRLNTGGREVVVSWPGELPAPVIDGPRALYENVRPGIDLLMTAQDGGYSHLLVVKDRKASADPLLKSLNYRLAGPGLTFRLDPKSGAVSARDAKGKEVAGAPSPLMWDSSGRVATTDGKPALAPSAVAGKHPSLGLAGLAGAEGAHLAVAKAKLTSGTLSLKADEKLLNAPDTKYPVFVDPSFKGHKSGWAHLYKTAGDSSFWNGQNFNAGGTNEARVGYESTTGGTSRAIFNFDFGSTLHGAGISDARVRALQTYSWSCGSRAMDIYSTPWVSSTNTWNNTSGWWGKKVASESAGYGYNSTCPDNWVAPVVKDLIQEAANNRWGAVSLGFRAASESDPYYWKKFMANGETAPYLEITYNRRPDVPVAANMTTSPGGACLTQAPVTSIGKTDVEFQVKGSDPDGNLKEIQIEIWGSDGSHPTPTVNLPVNSDGRVTHRVTWDKFASGRTYYWLARAFDYDGWMSPGSGPLDSGGGGWCTFTVDHTAPASPAVRSVHFPQPGPDGSEWSLEPAGTDNQWVEFLGNGTKAEDIREYQWSLNRPLYDQKTSPWSADLASIKLKVDTAGPNVLYVRTVSKAGNVSAPTTYLFYVRPRPGQDKPGDVTGDGLPDILGIDAKGNLRTYAGDAVGDTDAWLPGALDDGKPVADGYWQDASGKAALISHATDWFPGDGLTDLVARMPDGKLYVYPGDGNGRFEVAQRMEILLPTGAPDPATLTQLVVTEDVTGDGMPDAFARAGDAFWAFSGYSGGVFAEARLMSATGWTRRDIIGVRDVSGDKIPDLLFRDDVDPNRGLALRKGKPGTNGGVDLASLATAGAALDAKDYTYGGTGWGRVEFPMIHGTPDATGDGIPDFWVVRKDGVQLLYKGGSATHDWPSGADEDAWNTFKGIG
ncbi:DNRLRE domain-containing protein [Streptomyces sp. NPDC101132]|uniref:DNRLRE domain-containing protein n=1 Tax=Streptomyces sp. NPDC101132 TaxID=3366110 RepID=UPI0038113C96